MRTHIRRTHAVAALVVLAAVAGLGVHGAPTRTASAEEAKKATSAAADHQHHATPTPAPKAGARGGTPMTITGEVMDPACFLEAGPKSIGPGHFQCAIDCAKSGQTLAIYDRPNDRIYFIAGELPGKNPNDPVMQYIHKLVDVTGSVYHRSGVYGIVITKVELHRGAAPAAAAAKGATK